jgi:hypothetical protein
MNPRFVPALSLLLIASFTFASQEPAAPKMSKQTRMDLVRAFNAELVYIRAPFPMGKKGLMVKDGEISPNGEELQQMMALWGPAAKPGDRAMITDIRVKDDRIHFEINGGPVKRKKWYQRIEVGGMGGTTPVAPSDPQANPRGSFVDLVFDNYVPELNPQQLKDLLYPVFDFNAKSAAEAYMETVPPKVKDAIKNHQVLVGMNREMVMYSKGRAPKKVREKQGENEYEEWIYGDPPQNVDFVRFVGDEVVRVETMKVNGEKTLRTEKEVELESASTVAKGPSESGEAQPSAKPPSLRRPGEALDTDSPADGPDRPQRPTAPPAGPPQMVQNRF